MADMYTIGQPYACNQRSRQLRSCDIIHALHFEGVLHGAKDFTHRQTAKARYPSEQQDAPSSTKQVFRH
eukprot:1158557-Pelagomonas_calceolata.AAC.6